MTTLETTYHAPSGQTIRQFQDNGINHIIIKEQETDYISKTNSDGADSYTSQMWASDVETIKRWCKDWAYYPEQLTFEIN